MNIAINKWRQVKIKTVATDMPVHSCGLLPDEAEISLPKCSRYIKECRGITSSVSSSSAPGPTNDFRLSQHKLHSESRI